MEKNTIFNEHIHSRNSKLRVRISSKCTKERSERSLMSKLAVTARKDKLAFVNTDIRTDKISS